MYLCVCVCWDPCESSSEKKKNRDLEMCLGLLRGQKIIFKKINKMKSLLLQLAALPLGCRVSLVPAWEKQGADKHT